ncbi:hypothetical protein HZ326_22946 [Fusarium oxysporum f. sp. albedinis]|nr:hypothetical protein HZ326_22946 [Fusarium oxysporum f. sp. albedinis]
MGSGEFGSSVYSLEIPISLLPRPVPGLIATPLRIWTLLLANLLQAVKLIIEIVMADLIAKIWKLVFPLFPFSDFHLLYSTKMGPQDAPEHVYCVQAGKKHYELFTTTYAGANYCNHCGLANPFRPQHRARSKTPAIPGPYDEVVEVEDSPPP